MRLAIGTRPAPDLRSSSSRRPPTPSASGSSTTTRSTCWCSTARRPRPAASASPGRSRTSPTTPRPTCVVIARAADRWLAAYAEVDATLMHPLDPMTTGRPSPSCCARDRRRPPLAHGTAAGRSIPPARRRPAVGERTWPHLLTALLRGEELATARHRLGDGRDHGRRRRPRRRSPPSRRAARQGRDRRPSWPGWSRRCSAAPSRSSCADGGRAAAVDVVGTGGDRAHTVNISTMAALVVAGAGVRVVKHGNRAASSACGTADVLEYLGVPLDLGPSGVARCVAEAGIGFCFAARFHPGMRHAGRYPARAGRAHRLQLPRPADQPGAAPRRRGRLLRRADGRR